MTNRRQMYELGEDDAQFFEWRRSHLVHIGHDVWIGHAAIVIPGVTIGNGAIIGSQAVVTKHVAPCSVVGGVPAHVIWPRFDPEVDEAIEASAWWDWPRDELEARFDELLDVERFLVVERTHS